MLGKITKLESNEGDTWISYIFKFSRIYQINLCDFSFFFTTFMKVLFLGKGIQVCSNERDRPSLRGDNSERVKKLNLKKKSSSPEPASQMQLRMESGQLHCI
jgi:hypothetical protein